MKHISYFLIGIAFVVAACQANSQTDEEKSTNQQGTVELVGPERFKTLLESTTDFQLIDVRTSRECAAGMLPKAQQIDFYSNTFTQQIGKLKKDAPVFIYCAVGGRSRSAAQMLRSMGFNRVYDLQGGYRSWRAKGFPINQ